MSKNTQLVSKSKFCLQAAKKASSLFTTRKTTIRLLSSIQSDASYLHNIAREEKEKAIHTKEELERERDQLDIEKNEYEFTVYRLEMEKRREEFILSLHRDDLSRAESDRREAEASLAEARREYNKARSLQRKVIVGSTILAVCTLGASGVGTLAAGYIGIKAFKIVQKMVERAELSMNESNDRIRKLNSDIASTKQSLSSIQRNISDYNDRITDNERRSKELHDKLTEVKKMLGIHIELVRVWEVVSQCSGSAKKKTRRLKEVIRKAEEKQDLEITVRDGTAVKAESMMKAWEEVVHALS